MTRLLILIFAFNAFFTPVFAIGVCNMSDETSVMNMSSSMDNMNCNMDSDTACSSADCISSCTITPIIPLSLVFYTPNIVAGSTQPMSGFAYFYKIIYPVNTPPPLV
jgi:hypothetical protein